MKSFLLSVSLLLTLSACQTHPNDTANISTVLLQNYVQNRCTHELNQRKEWQIVSILMSEKKKQEWENKICTCASEEAPKQLASTDFSPLLSQNGLSKISTEITIKTVNACVQRLLNPHSTLPKEYTK